MKRFRIFTAVFLMLCLFVTVFSGCDSKQDTPPVPQEQAQETAPQAQQTTDMIATLGDREISTGFVSICYAEARENFISSLGKLAALVLNPNQPLSEQSYMNEQFPTWGDYLLDTAVRDAAEMYLLADQAAADGFVLPEEVTAAVDKEIAKAEDYAAQSKGQYENADAFFSELFGAGCTAEIYREYLLLNTTAKLYQAQKLNSLQFNDQEINDYYAGDPLSFREVSFQMFDLSASLTASEDDPMDACRQLAESMAAAVTDEKSFNELCKQFVPEEEHIYYDRGAITFFRDKTYEELGKKATYRDWLFDEARQPGDLACISYTTEEDQGWYVVRFVEQTDLNYPTVNFHQILVENYSSDAVSREALQATAQTIYDAYLSGEQSEEAFLALVQRNPSGSTYSGTYNDAAHGALRNAYESWLFDPARQPGDTVLLESEQGFHVMYFSGKGDTHFKKKVIEAMTEDSFNTWLAEITQSQTPIIDEAAAAAFVKY